MKKEVVKEMYVLPRIAVRRVVFEGVVAYSYHPSIAGTVNYEDYESVYSEVETQSGKDVLIF
jgi:hypothetical protein